MTTCRTPECSEPARAPGRWDPQGDPVWCLSCRDRLRSSVAGRAGRPVGMKASKVTPNPNRMPRAARAAQVVAAAKASAAPLTRAEVAKAAGVTEGALSRVLASALESGDLVRAAHGRYAAATPAAHAA